MAACAARDGRTCPRGVVAPTHVSDRRTRFLRTAMSDIRDVFISRVVDGRSFAEVGGLWGTVNEKVSVAHQRGAQALAMFDTAPEGHMWWQKFEERRASLNVPDVRCVS